MNERCRAVLKEDVKKINAVISDCVFLSHSDSARDRVIQAECYALSAGGKRIRPVLCMEFYRLCGGTFDISDIAVCLELMHTFSLIHDDMPEMDNDSLRRGKPSVHVEYGQDIALLAGDGLSILPFEIISSYALDGRISALVAAKLIHILSSAAGNNGMIMGQVLDLCSENCNPDIDYLTKMSALKTGRLLTASCLFGATLANADGDMLKSAKAYAENLGLAFQIVDDILDVIGDEKLLGKHIGNDKERNKKTFADILGVERAGKLAAEYTQMAVDAIKGYDGSELLCELAYELAGRKL